MPRLSRPARAAALLAPLLAACSSGPPEGIEPVTGFQVERYMGRWYEIARLDHRFERGLERITADYELQPDGTVAVTNRGWSTADGEWREAEGRAKFTGDPRVGALKVSFFGPFYGSYNVIELDDDYSIALVAGPTRSYLWILARTPDPPRDAVERLVARARELGFATDELIRVEH